MCSRLFERVRKTKSTISIINNTTAKCLESEYGIRHRYYMRPCDLKNVTHDFQMIYRAVCKKPDSNLQEREKENQIANDM